MPRRTAKTQNADGTAATPKAKPGQYHVIVHSNDDETPDKSYLLGLRKLNAATEGRFVKVLKIDGFRAVSVDTEAGSMLIEKHEGPAPVETVDLGVFSAAK